MLKQLYLKKSRVDDRAVQVHVPTRVGPPADKEIIQLIKPIAKIIRHTIFSLYRPEWKAQKYGLVWTAP
jgi:hypothetical protein